MPEPERSLDQVHTSLIQALSELDKHGEAMAALHIAMAVDCLRGTLDAPVATDWERTSRPRLRLIASS
jgi:hypothetical protein